MTFLRALIHTWRAVRESSVFRNSFEVRES